MRSKLINEGTVTIAVFLTVEIIVIYMWGFGS